MTADATAASVTLRGRTRPAIANAGRVVVAGILLGFAGQLLFFDVGIGLNAPIAIGLALATAWLTRRPRARPSLADAWFGPAALLLASFVALRADVSIVALDLLAAAGLTALALVSFTGRNVMRSTFGAVIALTAEAMGWVVAGFGAALAEARRAIPDDAINLDRARPAIPVLRGLFIALPVLVVFVALFSAADAVFARVVEEVFSFELDLGDAPGRLALGAAIAWLAIGALAMTAATPAAAREPVFVRGPWRLGTTEALTVLASVLVVFTVFVGLQAAYLFGGIDTLAVTGMTYAEYARRGFFELVAVAILSGGLVISLDRLVRRRTIAIVAGSIGLAGLTGVVVASAALRMQLYQQAYGWTELRLYVLATIVLLAILLAVLMAALATDRVRWIGHAILVIGLGVGIALNVIGPVRFITEQNVARALDPSLVPEHGTSGLDAEYLGSLNMDAVPGLLAALPNLHGERAALVREELAYRLAVLRREPDAWQAWNAGRATALELLRAAEARGLLADR